MKRVETEFPDVVLTEEDYQLLRGRKRISCTPLKGPARLRKGQLVRVFREAGPELRNGIEYVLVARVRRARSTQMEGGMRVDLQAGVFVLANREHLKELAQHPYRY